ncbi:MAG: choice-of-anchor J domain-containing protein [Bacteroidales bacterium]
MQPGDAIYIINEDGQFIGPITDVENKEFKMYSTVPLNGEEITLLYVKPQERATISSLHLSEIVYVYYDEKVDKDLGDAQSCQVNINCSPEGDNWQVQKRGVARISFKEGGYWYLCSGTLINNTANDGTPYFLTAYHCGGDASASDRNVWQFYFNYERPGCPNTGTPPNNVITGCTYKAGGGISGGSDFQLVLLSSSPSLSWNPYYNGWSRSTTASPSGVSIHHPSGDAKKISTYTQTLTTGSWSGGMSSAHWVVRWAQTTNGWGVTEGGSSGSPIFDNNKRVVGTLTGGNSDCSNQSTARDYYGKFSKHWDANGTTNSKKLQPWLDPLGTNPTTLNGYDPNGGSSQSGYFSLDFEACADWSTDFTPWTSYDGDGKNTYGSSDCDFTGEGTAFGFMAFNPSLAGCFTTHGGQRCGVSICPVDATESNDWIISPQIQMRENGSISFWVYSPKPSTWGTETYDVLVSTTNNQPSSFTAIASNEEAPNQWTKKTYSLSAYNNQQIYIGIRHRATDKFMMMIDDILIDTGTVSSVSPVASFTYTPTTICAGSQVQFINTSQNATSYSWSFPGGNPSTSTQTNPIVTYNNSGIHIVTLIAYNGSLNNSTSQNIIVYPKPQLSTTIQNVSYYGGNDGAIYLSVAGGLQPYSYQWNTGATTQNLINISAGTYYVTVTDSRSCKNNTSATVTQPSDIIDYNLSNLAIIFPNPASDYLNINFDYIPQNNQIKIKIISSIGKIAYESDEVFSSMLSIPIYNLTTGTYIFSVLLEDNWYYSLFYKQ